MEGSAVGIVAVVVVLGIVLLCAYSLVNALTPELLALCHKASPVLKAQTSFVVLPHTPNTVCFVPRWVGSNARPFQ